MTLFRYQPLRHFVPRLVYADEAELSRWLRQRDVSGFFWEVGQYGDWVLIEVIEIEEFPEGQSE